MDTVSLCEIDRSTYYVELRMDTDVFLTACPNAMICNSVMT